MTIALKDRRFIVGIDLGTTNCEVAFLDTATDGLNAGRIRSFPITQLVAAGEVSSAPALPSFLYLPGEYDISREAVVRLWDGAANRFAGIFARDPGSGVPERLVSSAKSWLCHAEADRRAKILPWGSGGDVPEVSPVTASAAYLEHIRMAWNTYWGADEMLHLEHQLVIVTVPASFDEVARELTLEAAKMAGLDDIILLEEPLAAFYSWLMRHEKDWRESVQPGEMILVCDVGGGTTDFTLIVLREHDGSPRFERIAVGDHLILGGDNIDLAIARRVEARLGGARRSMSTRRWKELCHQCRRAKELLLSGAKQEYTISMVGTGSKLIADTFTAVLRQAETTELILEGFFPLVAKHLPPAGSGSRKGITEFGLPYEQEPAITKHLLWFLNRHTGDVRRSLNRSTPLPDWILCNGGSLKPAIVQQRIQTAVGHGFQAGKAAIPQMLENPDLDNAVALGAAYYGLVKIGRGVKVGSGSPRAYYLEVACAETAGQSAPQAVCVVERGLEEGSSISLANRSFEVLTNQPVSFNLYSSSYRSGDRHGEVIAIDDSLTPLPPLQTVVQYGKKGVQRTLPVQIEAEFTEIGTLALRCRSEVSDHRWQLGFQLRSDPRTAEVADDQILDAGTIAAARQHVRRVLTGSDKQAVEKLLVDLAGLVALPRDDWPLGLIRSLADALLTLEGIRQTSPVHESGWMNLLGFCLRPGIGESFDEQRVGRLWKHYLNGSKYPRHPRVRLEWWILWRRVAAGLNPGQQRHFFQNVSAVLFNKKGAPKASAQERLEIWMALANMEKLDAAEKIALGKQLIRATSPKQIKPQHLWSLSRLGARELLYGPVNRVIAPQEAAGWIKWLLELERSNPVTIARAVSQLARKTNDRARDLDDKTRAAVLAWMQAHDLPANLIDPVREPLPVERRDQKAMFGESLPSGIILKA